MKKLALIVALSLPISTGFASGIPVVDVAAMTQMVLDATNRAVEFKETIVEARNRLNELRSQGEHYKRMVDGHYDFEDVLNDPYLNDVFAMEDWKQIYENVEDIADLRREFNMYSDDPIMQRRYDNRLRQYRMQTMFYDNSVNRNKRMMELLDQFKSASNPAAKADLANAISYEKMQLENDKQMQASLTTMMERQRVLEADTRSRENIRLLFNEGIPRS